MKFHTPFKKARLIQRYKRFFVEIQHKNEVLTAHLANTGSLKGVFEEGLDCLLTESKDPKRKLKLSLQLIKHPSSLVGVNTSLANQIVFEAWRAQKLPYLKKFQFCQKEVKINEKTRIDLVLSSKPIQERLNQNTFKKLSAKEKKNFHFMEIKNVTLAHTQNKKALFPDAVTKRGQKHLKELIEKVEKGYNAEIFFLAQRSDCKFFSPEKEIDPEYADLLTKAHKKGVKISSYGCLFGKNEILLNPRNKLKIIL